MRQPAAWTPPPGVPDTVTAQLSTQVSRPEAVEAARPEVRLRMDAKRRLTPDEIQQAIIKPSGVSRVLALLPVDQTETRIACRTWADAFKILSHCTPELQRRLSVRCRPSTYNGVTLTKAEMARLAHAETAPTPTRSPIGLE